MRRVLGFAVVATMVIVALAPSAGAKPKPKAKPVVLTQAQITPALLALADMPTGYAAIAIDPSATTPSATAGVCNGPNQAARAQNQSAAAGGESEFGQNPTTGPVVIESVYSFPTKAKASAFLAATRGQAQCPPYNVATSTGSETDSAAQVSTKKLGDDTASYRLTIQGSRPDTVAGSFDYVLVRIGNHVVNVAQGGLTGANTSELQPLVAKALSKLGVAIQGAKKSGATTTSTTKKK